MRPTTSKVLETPTELGFLKVHLYRPRVHTSSGHTRNASLIPYALVKPVLSSHRTEAFRVVSPVIRTRLAFGHGLVQVPSQKSCFPFPVGPQNLK